ncbi:MAG TPA: NifB/NifX family molybdenum-iron cluster-binding protein [Syntrophomonadaceae bacterium]|nr:NifB/NifX family molybdenum-iron cluster-binding protein [Syntrophomonadaceae bacterium]
MIIAVAEEESMVCQHFEYCQHFGLFDTETGTLKVIDNPGHQPGFLPEFLGKLGVQVVIAGGMGGRAQELFASRGIQVLVGASGPIKEVVQRFLNGELLSSGSVCSEHEHAGDCHE